MAADHRPLLSKDTELPAPPVVSCSTATAPETRTTVVALQGYDAMQLATPRPRKVPSSDTLGQNMTTPQRRSVQDLQILIDELFEKVATTNEDGVATCRVADLPKVLAGFEERRQIALLDEDERGSLEAFAEQHPDLDVSSHELVNLLAAMTAQGQNAGGPTNDDNYNGSSSSNIHHHHASPPGSPTPASKTLPPTPGASSDGEDGMSDYNTRHARSASASSGSSESSRNSNTLTGQGMLDGPDGSPTPDETAFPRSYSMPSHLTSPPPTPLASSYPRARTSSNPEEPGSHSVSTTIMGGGGGIGGGGAALRRSQHVKRNSIQSTPVANHTLVAARQRSSPLEAQPIENLRRSRPAPPKSRRISGDNFGRGRLSSEGVRSRQNSEEPDLLRVGSPEEGIISPPYLSLDRMQEHHEDGKGSSDGYASPGGGSNGRSRQSSGRSAREQSPLFGMETTGHSTTSPIFSPTSPSIDATSFHRHPTSPHDVSLFDLNTIDPEDYAGGALGPLHSRPVSTVSMGSEAAMQEMIQQLQQELARKTQDLEAQRADGYAAIMEKEALLEEVRLELAAKRREEKELRGKEKLNLTQIATLESQTATFRDERDKQKAAYQSVRKQYEEQCNESEKLRNIIRTKDEELRLADENVQNSASDLAKIARERDYLQTTVTRLESELAEAKQTIDALEEQKHENLQLRETIDRLRLDLDELRAQARLSESAKGSMTLTRSASGSDGLPATLSRNLGRELARKLQAGSNGASSEEEEGGNDDDGRADESYEEEIVTTRRLLKRPAKKAQASSTKVADAAGQASDEQQEQFVLSEVVDVQIQVEPPPVPTAETTTQTDPESEPSKFIKRTQLAKDLEVDLDAVDAYVQAKKDKERLSAAIPDTAPPPYHQMPRLNGRDRYADDSSSMLPTSMHDCIQLVLSNSSNFVLYSLLIYLAGLLTGYNLLSPRDFYHTAPPHDFWGYHNTLGLQQVTSRGLWSDGWAYWIQKLVWRGVSVARRVPT